CILFLTANGCGRWATQVATGDQNATRNRSTNVNAIVALIEACPSWLQATDDDASVKRKIVDDLKRISAYAPREVRAAMAQYIERQKSKGVYWFHEYGKIFVLNRFYLNVPAWVSAKEFGVFGGWTGVPRKNGQIALLWPLERRADGQLELMDVSAGYL